jgi:hypothetical protein
MIYAAAGLDSAARAKMRRAVFSSEIMQFANAGGALYR